MNLMHLVAELDELLDAEAVPDYCPNGLQVEGRPEVRRVVTAVSASRVLFERALDEGADLVLVHHGLLWNAAEPARLVGSHLERIRLLLAGQMSLVAYHLPLDRHPTHGNAAQLALELGMTELEPFGDHKGVSTGVCGVFVQPQPVEELVDALADACNREPQLFRGDRRMVSSVGIVTGSSPRDYHTAVQAGLDAFITGEASEWVMHQAVEDGVHFLAAGHYATERFGVIALGHWLSNTFDLDVTFIDLPNPV